MPFSAPTAMLLLVLLPFLAGMATGAIPPLVSLTTSHRRLFGCVSASGGAVYLAGMIGLIPGAIALGIAWLNIPTATPARQT